MTTHDFLFKIRLAFVGHITSQQNTVEMLLQKGLVLQKNPMKTAKTGSGVLVRRGAVFCVVKGSSSFQGLALF